MSERKNDLKSGNRVERSKKKSSYILYVLMAIVFVLILSLSYVVFIKGDEYVRKAAEQHTTKVNDKTMSANRGEITDRSGLVIALSKTVYTVVVDVKNLHDMDIDKEKIDAKVQKNIDVLSEVLEVPREEMENLYAIDKSTGRPVNDQAYKIIAKKVDYEKGQEIIKANLTGVYLEEDTVREYPHNNFASQVIGFLRGDNVNDYYGLEYYYNSFLEGTSGRIYRTYTDSGQVVSNDSPAIKGDKVVTTLDANIQKFAEDIVLEYGERYQTENASIIVMNPKTAEIYAMAEYPSFNNNAPGHYEEFSKTSFAKTYKDTPKEEQGALIMDVWKNFNVSSTFEPGSTYKPSVVAAALEEGIISKSDTFTCNGSIELDNGDVIRCWNTNGHGTQKPTEVLSNSCNVGMIKITKKMGSEIFAKYQSDFGFGEVTGIDLPGEASAENLVYSAEDLNETELATSSMGQGFNGTIIQSINAFASVINGGNLMKPYIVSEVVSADNELKYKGEPQLIRKTISKDTSDYLRTEMQKIVDDGTGKSAKINGYSIGGKTGTAEQGIRSENKRTLSFVAYFPVEDPEYIVMSVLHLPKVEGFGGGSAAAPMTREIIEKIIEFKEILPNDVEEVDTNKGIEVPNLVGKTVQKATEQLNNLGFNFQVVNSGNIVQTQSVKAKTLASKNDTIFLQLSDDKTDKLIAVPDIINKSFDSSKKTLEDLGFNTKYFIEVNGSYELYSNSQIDEYIQRGAVSTKENLVVKRTSIKTGLKVPKGTSINIFLGEKSQTKEDETKDEEKTDSTSTTDTKDTTEKAETEDTSTSTTETETSN